MNPARSVEELLNETATGYGPSGEAFNRIAVRSAVSGMIRVGRLLYTVKGQRGGDPVTLFTVAKVFFDLDFVRPTL